MCSLPLPARQCMHKHREMLRRISTCQAVQGGGIGVNQSCTCLPATAMPLWPCPLTYPDCEGPCESESQDGWSEWVIEGQRGTALVGWYMCLQLWFPPVPPPRTVQWVEILSGISLCSCVHCGAGDGQENVAVIARRRGGSSQQLYAAGTPSPAACKCSCFSLFLSPQQGDDSKSFRGGWGERERAPISWCSFSPPQKKTSRYKQRQPA